MCRQTSFDTPTGKATKSYDDDQVHPGDEILTIKELWPFLGYFGTMHNTECTNRYTDHRGHTDPVKGTTGGQQGDPPEMNVLVCLSTPYGPRARMPPLGAQRRIRR